MSFRALAIDLDGTLLSPGEVVSEQNQDAVKAARNAGLEIILATAGWYQRAERVAQLLVLDGPAITCSGAEVRRLSDGADLMDVRLEEGFASRLYEIIDSVRCIAWVALDDVVLMKAEGEIPANMLPAEMKHVASVAAAADVAPRMVLVQSSGAAKAIRDQLEVEYSGRVHFMSSQSGYGKPILTMTAMGAHKGVALDVACRDLGISLPEVVAIGDSDNDIEMFSVAGGSFAMGQATDEIKAAARAVTGTNEEDGVAQAIERLLAEGEAVFTTD
jgi:Cof subfamily protein (haloacid dehalogenase superfamily)